MRGIHYAWKPCLWVVCLMNDFSGRCGFQRWRWEAKQGGGEGKEVRTAFPISHM